MLGYILYEPEYIFFFFREPRIPMGQKCPPPPPRQPRGGKTPRPCHSWGGSPWFPGPMGKIDSLDPCGGGGPLFLLAFWATSSLLDHSHSFPNHTRAPLQARQIICKLINHRLLSLSLSHPCLHVKIFIGSKISSRLICFAERKRTDSSISI